jgi:hypothetical protein
MLVNHSRLINFLAYLCHEFQKNLKTLIQVRKMGKMLRQLMYTVAFIVSLHIMTKND